MRISNILVAVAIGLGVATAPAYAGSSVQEFNPSASDRSAIATLLRTYTTAVSTKNQTMFESILLGKDIPLSYVPSSSTAMTEHGTRGYEGFRKAVFGGAPFTQSFKDVHVHQDGNLANVTLVFVNVDARGSTWGWKTMQLLKADGTWKIASEFFTGH